MANFYSAAKHRSRGVLWPIFTPALIVHRETLYSEVWEEPISKLALRYNISDVALAKVCRKLQVPVPPRGYWARIQHGQHVIRPKLPKLPNGSLEAATISPVLLRSRALPDAVLKQREFEAEPAHRISVDPNRELHPLVRKTRAVLNGRTFPNDKEFPLAVHVSKALRERALLLVSTLLYAFEERGFKIEVRSGQNGGSIVVIHDEPLRFSVDEEARREAGPKSKTTSADGANVDSDAATRLTFRIHDFWASGFRRSWSDGARRSLEEQLNDMIPALVDLSLVIREKRLESERRTAEIHEEFRQRDLEQSRRRQMESDSRNWRTSTELRSLIAEVQGSASEEEIDSPEVTRWLSWANWVASESDPLKGGVKAFIERYKF